MKRSTTQTLLPAAFFLAGLASGPAGYAQQVVAPLSPAPSSSRPTGDESLASTSSGTAPGSFFSPAPSAPLSWGPFNVRPHFIYRILYSDGLQASPGHPTSTTINSFSPGALIEFGTHWTLDFASTLNEYSSRLFRDTLDHTGKLAWTTTYEGWVLNASQIYNRSNSPMIETGRQTKETDHLTNLGASYLFADSLISETVVNRDLRFVEGFNDTRDWSVLEFLHFKQSPELDSALGLQYGAVKTTHAPDMSTLQFLARTAWHYSERLSFDLQGGWENRHVKQSGAPDFHTPIISASCHYTPVETTHLAFTAARSTSVSLFADQVVEHGQYGLALEQRLLGRFRLTAGLDYQTSRFRSTLSTVPVNREDKTSSFNAGLHAALLHRIDVALQYQKSHNSSNVAGFGFSSDQIGLEVGYQY